VRWLGTALFAEGPTDHRFLQPLLRRACEALCASRGRGPVEIADVRELHSPVRARDQDRETRILEAARDSWGAWHILFVHADGAGDPERARAEQVVPAFRDL